MNDVLIVEELAQVKIFLYEKDIVEGANVKEFARTRVGKRSNTVQLLRYNSHICYVTIPMLFPNPSSAHRAINLLLILETWQGIWRLARNDLRIFRPKPAISCVEHYLTNWARLASLIQTTKKFFTNLANFEFYFNLYETGELQGYRNNNRVWEAHPMFGVISPNLIQEPISFCGLDLCDWVSSLIDALEILATQNKCQMKMNFFQFERTIKNKLARVQEVINQRRSYCVGIEAEDDNFKNSSLQFLQMQKSHFIDKGEHFER